MAEWQSLLWFLEKLGMGGIDHERTFVWSSVLSGVHAV
jgi:hypothetical protein